MRGHLHRAGEPSCGILSAFKAKLVGFLLRSEDLANLAQKCISVLGGIQILLGVFSLKLVEDGKIELNWIIRGITAVQR